MTMANEQHPLTVVVLPHGWVFVGRRELRGDTVYLHDAHNVRRWGTNAGLGQLASEGPLAETVLDPCPGGVDFHYLQELCRFACVEAAWKGKLA